MYVLRNYVHNYVLTFFKTCFYELYIFLKRSITLGLDFLCIFVQLKNINTFD